MESIFTPEARERIRRLSAYSLPDDPTGRGWKPNEVRRTLYQPIVEILTLLAGMESGIGTDMEDLRTDTLAVAESARETAASAQETAAAAQETADTAQQAAEAAQGSADSAQQAADSAAEDIAALEAALEALRQLLDGKSGLSAEAAEALLAWMAAANTVMAGLSTAVSGILSADLVYGTADAGATADDLRTLAGITSPSAGNLPSMKQAFADALDSGSDPAPEDSITFADGVLTIQALAHDPTFADGVLSIS